MQEGFASIVGNSDHFADHSTGHVPRVLRDQVALPPTRKSIDEFPRDSAHARLHRGHTARCEGAGDQCPQAVVARRIEGLDLRQQVSRHTSAFRRKQSGNPRRPAHVLVARKRPASALRVLVDGLLVAQPAIDRVEVALEIH